jgi:pimeloyl-ACP methyl ester carboxylesterase
MRLVLLPGLHGTEVLFHRFVEELPAGIQPKIIAYPHEKLTYVELTDHVLPRLPRHEPFVLLGESFSGPIAIEVARRDPRVRGLILCCSFARRPWPVPGALGWLAPPWDDGMGMWYRQCRWLARLSGVPAEERVHFANTLHETPLRVVRFRMREVLAVDVTNTFQQLHMPILNLRAKRDRLVPRNDFPNPVVLDGTHFLLQSNPHAAAALVSEFVRTVLTPAEH